MSLIRLYDEIISVPEGMTYAELLKERGREEKPVLLAREDGKLRELGAEIAVAEDDRDIHKFKMRVG